MITWRPFAVARLGLSGTATAERRSASASSDSVKETAASEINTVAAKSPQGVGIATSTRLSAAKGSDIWMRIMMLAPSASTMSVTMLGDVDLTQMRGFFAKPQTAIAMSFSDDPMMGMSCDHFAGSAITTLETTSFVLRTAWLH